MYKQIAFVKIGWSDHYEGGPVLGRHAHVQEHNEAHEQFNFLRHSNGKYYGYLPPIGGARRPPQPKNKENWLLIFVSAKNGNGPLTVVGWYERATLHEEYVERPEYSVSEDFKLNAHGGKYIYCLSSDAAYLIPTTSRTDTVSGERFKRTPILYVRGNGKHEGWRDELAEFAESLVAEKKADESHLPKFFFPDSKQRKLIEEAAIKVAKEFLNKQYRVEDRQKDNCGYDLLALHLKTKEEIHVEVKGTSGSDRACPQSCNFEL